MKRCDELLMDLGYETGKAKIGDLTAVARAAESEGNMGVVNAVLDRLENEKVALLDSGRDILDLCDEEKRGLQADEARRHDAKLADVETINSLIKRLQRTHRRALAEDANRSVLPAHFELRGGDNVRGRSDGNELRALGISLFTDGAVLAPDQQSDRVWDRLAAEAVLLKAGARVLVTDKPSLVIPKLNADSTATWTGESEEIAESSPTLAGVVAIPKKVAALVRISNELVSDSNPDVMSMVMDQLTRSLTLALDLAFFEGTGTENQPRGISKYTSINSVSMGVNGAVPTDLDQIAEAIGLIEADNGKPSAIVMHPEVWAVFAQLKTGTDHNDPLVGNRWDVGAAVQRRLFGLPVFLSSQLSRTEVQGNIATASSIYVIDGSQVAVVRNGNLRLEVDKSLYFNYDQTAIRATARTDMVLPNPLAVCRIYGVKTS